jgi:ribonuclease HI
VAIVSLIKLYIAGACTQQRGYALGGWSYVRHDGRKEQVDHGIDPRTTIQRMRLTAAIKGLQVGPSRRSVLVITTDESFVATMKDKLSTWERNYWRDVRGRAIRDADLWRILQDVVAGHSVEWKHLRVDQVEIGDAAPLNSCIAHAQMEVREAAVDATTTSFFEYVDEIARNGSHLAGPMGEVLVKVSKNGAKQVIPPATGAGRRRGHRRRG